MEIIQKDNGKSGAFIAMHNGNEVGEMTYNWLDEKNIVVNHTGVRPQYEGRGVGRQLMETCVGYARENQIKILPLCSFVQTMFNRYPDYSDTKA
jgi:Predicted acetyltransferase